MNVAVLVPGCGSSCGRSVLSLPAGLTGSALVIMLTNVLVNRKLLHAFWKAGGSVFALKALAYYLLVYPMAVGAGACRRNAGVCRRNGLRSRTGQGRHLRKEA